MHPIARSLLAGFVVPALAFAQTDPDRDGDGLSDFQEVHKYRTDPARADSDGDGVPDGDWLERREYQYTIRTVVQVMRPVTIDWLCDDYQDARVLDETDDYVELEVVHYPFNTVAAAIVADPKWRDTAAPLRQWLAPGPTSDWTPALRQQLTAALAKDGIDVRRLDDKALVEQASRWLCAHAKHQDCFTTFVTAFDGRGEPSVPQDLLAATGHDRASLERQWPQDISARGMFERGVRGSCSSSAIYLSGCLRALGIPTRTILTIPLVDGNEERELQLAERGLTNHRLRAKVLPALRRLQGSWSSHTFNEVFVGGRWRRLNYDRLGQNVYDPGLFGVLTHIATLRDWADAHMPDTIGRRQTLRRYDDVFGGPNPYSTIALRDAFGPHCDLTNPEPERIAGQVTAVVWGDGEGAPEHIRAWFAKRGVFGLVARVEGPASFDEVKQLLAANDLRVLLTARGAPTLGVGFDPGAYWWQQDHAMIVVPFGGGDRRDYRADLRYAFVCRNQGAGAAWQVADGVTVPPRADGDPARPAGAARVTALAWGDGGDVPDEIRAWFAKRSVFGLVARIDGPSSFEEFKALLANNDLRVSLTAPGAPVLGVSFEPGAFWWMQDHAMIVVPFGAGDRRDYVAEKRYTFACRNQGDGGGWQVADGVSVPARAN